MDCSEHFLHLVKPSAQRREACPGQLLHPCWCNSPEELEAGEPTASLSEPSSSLLLMEN